MLLIGSIGRIHCFSDKISCGHCCKSDNGTASLICGRKACRLLQPPLRVEWAEGKSDGDQTTVKSLHVSNLPDNCTEEKITATFQALGGPIEKVAMMEPKPGDTRKRNFAFVHFDKRSTALRVLEVCTGSYYHSSSFAKQFKEHHSTLTSCYRKQSVHERACSVCNLHCV
jgi:hypothetical protein